MAKSLGIDDYRNLSGIQKTAIMIMSMDEASATSMFAMFEDEEIKELSGVMAGLGSISNELVERIYIDFSEKISAAGVVLGNYDTTEKLLAKALGQERVDSIMEDIRGPAGRTTWDKLANVNEEVLASYLRNEYPQTIALVMSKISPDHAARVLSVFPEELSMEVIMRILSMESVKKEVLDGVERTLRVEFMSNLAKTQRRDSHEMIADIFNNFDRNTEAKFMGKLEDENLETAENVKSLMFTFEDLSKIDAAGIQTILRKVDNSDLALALKGASETIKTLFTENMSERASKILLEDMQAMGPVRLKDVDEAQSSIVNNAKDLAARNEIVIADAGGDEQLVY